MQSRSRIPAVLVAPVALIALIALITSADSSPAQSRVFQVSKSFDSTEGPSAFPIPGLAGAFRQQILISDARLAGLRGRVKGIWIRRDLSDTDALKGGAVDLAITLSTAPVPPHLARESFAANQAQNQVAVFTRRISVPDAPRLGSTAVPWHQDNSIRVDFAKPFDYQGGHLCIDIIAYPVQGAEPHFWFIDFEEGNYTGGSRAIGSSCSAFANSAGKTLFTNDLKLQTGSTMQLRARGRPGSTPLLMLGASEIPGGVDLSPLGAPGCRQHIRFFAISALTYTQPKTTGYPARLHFETQIPNDANLLGASVFTQFADSELALAAANRSNAAALTTSNGLELKISSVAPDLGMAIVTSHSLQRTDPVPTKGSVDVSIGPVLRILY